MYRRVMAIT